MSEVKKKLGKGGISSLYTLLIALGITMLMGADGLSDAFFVGVTLIMIGVFLPFLREALEKISGLPFTDTQIDEVIIDKLFSKDSKMIDKVDLTKINDIILKRVEEVLNKPSEEATDDNKKDERPVDGESGGVSTAADDKGE